MKKKVIAVFLATAMTFGLTACGSSTPSASDITGNRKQETAEETTEEDTKEEAEVPEASAEVEEDTKSTPKGVVFGSKEAAGYTDFAYLTEAIVSTSDTKSGNKASYSVYIPDDEYPYVSGSSASSQRMGVDFEIDIAPYLQYDAQDYTVVENLEEYVESQMSYASSNYYGITVGEVREMPDGSASCEVSYMEYNSYDNVYAPFYVQYNLKEMEDGLYALSEVRISADETTGKTADLLKELSDFYQFDINWDASFADTKRAEFENSDEYNPDAYNLGFMSFELPEGWDEDEDESSYDQYVFAPEGNYALADAAIVVTNDWSSDDVVTALLSDEDYTKSYFETVFGGMGEDVTIKDITVENMGETFIGKTAKITVVTSDSTGSGTVTFFMGQVDYEVYAIYAYAWEEESVDEAIDMIFETGKVKQ